MLAILRFEVNLPEPKSIGNRVSWQNLRRWRCGAGKAARRWFVGRAFTVLKHKVKYNAAMHINKFGSWFFGIVLVMVVPAELHAQTQFSAQAPTNLPNGQLLGLVPGDPRPTNNFPTAAAISPDGRFGVLLHSGFGTYTLGEKQSLTLLNLQTSELRDFPDDRLGSRAKQTYFLGLAFSIDGKHLYASMASLTDPLGKEKGSTGNGIAVYSFENGAVTPERFLPLTPREKLPLGKVRRDQFQDVTYPAGLSVGMSGGQQRILVACNGSDEAVLLNSADGKIVHRFNLSTYKRIPGTLPYTT